jgi:hypothetical protein
MVVARLPEGSLPKPGDTPGFKALPGKRHWFDAAAGARLEFA